MANYRIVPTIKCGAERESQSLRNAEAKGKAGNGSMRTKSAYRSTKEANMKSRFVIASAALCALLVTSGTLRTDAAELSAHDAYVQALNVMSQLQQPPYVTYTLQGASRGLEAELSETCRPCLSPGKSSSHWSVWHRTNDYASLVQNDLDSKQYLSYNAQFDPTWYGAYHALHTGMIHRINEYRVSSRGTPAPLQPTPAPQATDLRTIAAVSAFGPAIYNVEDRGSAPCPDGRAGRALHLWSRDRDPHHQLSDVVIELATMRFCVVRLALNAPGALGGNGMWEVHFRQIGKYWMVTDGAVEGTMRVLGFSAFHGYWDYRLSGMQFPAALPDSLFAKPKP